MRSPATSIGSFVAAPATAPVSQHRGDGAQNIRRHATHLAGLGDGEFEHISHTQAQALTSGQPPLNLHLQDLRPVALAIAIGAAQVHVAEELHLHMLEARAAAGGTAAVAAVEAEFGRGVATLIGYGGSGEYFSN